MHTHVRIHTKERASKRASERGANRIDENERQFADVISAAYALPAAPRRCICVLVFYFGYYSAIYDLILILILLGYCQIVRVPAQVLRVETKSAIATSRLLMLIRNTYVYMQYVCMYVSLSV